MKGSPWTGHLRISLACDPTPQRRNAGQRGLRGTVQGIWEARKHNPLNRRFCEMIPSVGAFPCPVMGALGPLLAPRRCGIWLGFSANPVLPSRRTLQPARFRMPQPGSTARPSGDHPRRTPCPAAGRTDLPGTKKGCRSSPEKYTGRLCRFERGLNPRAGAGGGGARSRSRPRGWKAPPSPPGAAGSRSAKCRRWRSRCP